VSQPIVLSRCHVRRRALVEATFKDGNEDKRALAVHCEAHHESCKHLTLASHSQALLASAALPRWSRSRSRTMEWLRWTGSLRCRLLTVPLAVTETVGSLSCCLRSIAFVRKKRRGAINQKQLAWLCEFEKKLKKSKLAGAGSDACIIC
jgi:hypothetical protein